MKVRSASEVAQSCPTLATPRTAAHQAPPSMGFSSKSTGVGCHCLLHSVLLLTQKKTISARYINYKIRLAIFRKTFNSQNKNLHLLSHTTIKTFAPNVPAIFKNSWNMILVVFLPIEYPGKSSKGCWWKTQIHLRTCVRRCIQCLNLECLGKVNDNQACLKFHLFQSIKASDTSK